MEFNVEEELSKKGNEFWKNLFESTKAEKRPAKRIKIERAFRSVLENDKREDIQAVIEDISQGTPIEFLSLGTDSIVFKTGENGKYVFKLGTCRQKFKIPYSPRIMMPLFRQQYDFDLYFEVFHRGENKNVEITEEMILEIFKELEAQGIFWGDARPDQLYYLMRENIIPDFILGKYINLFGFDNEMLSREEYTSLKEGDLVIGDLDYLYSAADPQKAIGRPCNLVMEYIRTACDENGKLKYNIDELIKNRKKYEDMQVLKATGGNGLDDEDDDWRLEDW